MTKTYSIKTLFSYACITSPFFGLFGAIPGFAAREFELQRTSNIFIFITGFTLFFWLTNILLVWLSSKYRLLQNNIIRIVISTAICALTIFITFHLLEPLPPPAAWKGVQMPPTHHQHRWLLPLTQFLSINTVIFILIELVILKKTKDSVTVEYKQLKLASLEARNNQLMQQLHPHFFFNSLSTLRSLIRRSPTEAENYLEQLAELLRFSTSSSSQSLVLLKEELELCTNYLNMQRVRFGNALFFSIGIDERTQQNGKVPVYALQALLENAIKHNILTREQPLFIEIQLSSDGHFILVKNNLQPKESRAKKIGIGLANLSERYSLLNEDDIRIEKSETHFCVTIKIVEDAGGNN